MQERPTFDELINRFGEIIAWHCLAEIEKAAGVMPRHLIADPQMRLTEAYQQQFDQSMRLPSQEFLAA